MSPPRLVLSLLVALVVASPGLARAGDGARLLRFVPAGSDMVFVVDVAGARKKPLVRAWADRTAGDPWRQRMQAAGIDLLRDVDTLLIAGTLDGEEKLRISICEGRFGAIDPGKFAADLREHSHGTQRYWANADSAVAVIGKRLVMAPPAAMASIVDLVNGKPRGAGRLARAAPVRAAIASADTRHHVWMAAALTPDLRRSAAGLGVDAQGLTLGVSIGADVRLEVKLLLADESSATVSTDQLRVGLPQAAGALASFGFAAAVSSLAVEREGSAVRVTATVSATELATLMALVGDAAGARAAPAAPPPASP